MEYTLFNRLSSYFNSSPEKKVISPVENIYEFRLKDTSIKYIGRLEQITLIDEHTVTVGSFSISKYHSVNKPERMEPVWEVKYPGWFDFRSVQIITGGKINLDYRLKLIDIARKKKRTLTPQILSKVFKDLDQQVLEQYQQLVH